MFELGNYIYQFKIVNDAYKASYLVSTTNVT
jgi:hypothetical protein